MVKFRLAKADLRYIFDITKRSLGHVCRKEAHQYIKFTGNDGMLQAASVDGYRMHCVSVPITVLKGNQPFSFLLKPFSIPAMKSSFIECTLGEKEIAFNFGEQKFIERLGKGIDDFIDFEKVIPKKEPVETIGFNPDYLTDALKGFRSSSSNPVALEIYDPCSPVIIRSRKNPEDFRLVLPTLLR